MSIPGAAGLLNKVYFSLKLRHQNFPINYVGVSVYRHLKLLLTLTPLNSYRYVSSWLSRFTGSTHLYNHYTLHEVTWLLIKCSYVTGFWKTDWIVTLGLFHFIGPANGYTCTLQIHSAITRLGWLVCFSRARFANPVNSWLRQWDP